MDDVHTAPATESSGSLLTGAYWLSSPLHEEKECMWCVHMLRAAAQRRRAGAARSVPGTPANLSPTGGSRSL